MKAKLKIAAALTSAAVFGGCASGGGGKSAAEYPSMGCLLSRVITEFGVYCPTPPPHVPSWADVKPGESVSGTTIMGLSSAVLYERDSDQTIRPGEIVSGQREWLAVRRNADGSLIPALYGDYGLPSRVDFHSLTENLAAAGQPGIAIGRSSDPNAARTPFLASAPGAHVGMFARPEALGWSYQSFGVWNGFGYNTNNPNGIVATSFGFPTRGGNDAIPITGTATFTGKLGGLYVSPTGQGSIAAADLTVSANFGTRSLAFASTGTVTTRDLATGTAAPNLNLSGTLGYSSNSGTFSGTLVNAGGTMSGSSRGQFYGPAAAELGGVFTVRSTTTAETFAGAYGAKR